MRAIMMSIQPQWVEKILNREKTIEVRKTKPKMRTPFKVYVYCTKGSKDMYIIDKDSRDCPNKLNTYCADIVYGSKSQWFLPPMGLRIDNKTKESKYTHYRLASGKVVAEFTCDKIYDIAPLIESSTGNCIQYEFRDCEYGTANHCLLFKELDTYLQGNYGYAWHISDLKIYDKPRELGEFYSGKQCKDWDKNMDDCVGYGLDYQEKCKHCIGGYIPLTRPFQSWGYVEEL